MLDSQLQTLRRDAELDEDPAAFERYARAFINAHGHDAAVKPLHGVGRWARTSKMDQRLAIASVADRLSEDNAVFVRWHEIVVRVSMPWADMRNLRDRSLNRKDLREDVLIWDKEPLPEPTIEGGSGNGPRQSFRVVQPVIKTRFAVFRKQRPIHSLPFFILPIATQRRAYMHCECRRFFNMADGVHNGRSWYNGVCCSKRLDGSDYYPSHVYIGREHNLPGPRFDILHQPIEVGE